MKCQTIIFSFLNPILRVVKDPKELLMLLLGCSGIDAAIKADANRVDDAKLTDNLDR